MIIHGKINRILKTGPTSVVEFEVDTWRAKNLEDLDQEKMYSLNIQEVKNKKSLNQNRTSWLIMTDIAKKEEMFPDANLIYLRLLKMAKIKTLTLMVFDKELIDEKDAEEGMTEITDEYLIKQLEKIYRVVIIHDRYKNEKGNNVSTVTCALGMSHFGKEAMARFIERLLFYAEMRGIDTSQYDFER